jgi:hypothetical protein
MSDDSTQGAGLAVSANADVVSALRAAAIKKVFVENLVILRAPGNRSEKNWSRLEQITNAIVPSIRPACSPHRAPFKTL